MSKFYAGIGSRETPKEILDKMVAIATHLGNIGYTLRSGHAGGADLAFESGAKHAQIWLPWAGFNYKEAPKNPNHEHRVVKNDDVQAYNSVKDFHPAPDRLSRGALALMARNYRQVVGYYQYPITDERLMEPNSEFVVCWTKDGKASGGTGQAIRLAESLGIPVYNLFFEQKYHEVMEKKNETV